MQVAGRWRVWGARVQYRCVGSRQDTRPQRHFIRSHSPLAPLHKLVASVLCWGLSRVYTKTPLPDGPSHPILQPSRPASLSLSSAPSLPFLLPSLLELPSRPVSPPPAPVMNAQSRGRRAGCQRGPRLALSKRSNLPPWGPGGGGSPVVA